MPRRKKKTINFTFEDALREAIEHFTEQQWLGHFSPLATPYFLGTYLQDSPPLENTLARGQAFQAIVKEAAADMWGTPLPTNKEELVEMVEAERIEQGNKGPRYYFLLLELRYLRQYFSPHTFPMKVFSIPGFVNVSSTRFFIHLEKALTQLGQLILKRLQPTFRLERPILNTTLIGRDAQIQACTADLQENYTVAINGPSGIGKTTLGTAVMDNWPTPTTFWFTIRPGLNNQLNSLLFSLGHFLNQWHASSLWLHLMANSDKSINPAQALGFLHNDLQHIQDRQPLLCVDETDLLRHPETSKEHLRIIELLESLREQVPLLLLGQRTVLDANRHYILEGFSPESIQALLQTYNIQLTDRQVQRLYQHTQGNPRLLELLLALYQTSSGQADLFNLPTAPTVPALLNRLWKRLRLGERHLLDALSVFRGFTPQDTWQSEEQSLQNLIAYHLVQKDRHGGVAMLPAFRELVYAELLPEERVSLHEQAAQVRLTQGEYTAAAYHYQQAEDYESAVHLWYTHRHQEIQRGQADAARAIFTQISLNDVQGRTQKQLKLLQNQLYELIGAADKMLAHMDQINWLAKDELTAEAHAQRATAYKMLGQLDKSLASYETTLSTLTHLTNQIIQTHYKRGQIHIQQGDVAQARQEVQAAHYELERLRGLVEFFAGDLKKAADCFHHALDIAQGIKQAPLIAFAQRWLMLTAGQQGDLPLAQQYAQETMAYYQRIGDHMQVEGIRAELAGMHNQAARYAEAIPHGETALHYFEQINHQAWVATICSNLAEAYLETGQIDKAKQFAHRVLQLEDAHTRPYALYTLGLAAEQEQDSHHAQLYLRQGINTAQQNSDKLIEAYLQRALGMLYLHQEQQPEAQASLEKAHQLFQAVGLESEAEKVHQQLTQL